MHFLKNLQSFLMGKEGFTLEGNKDVYAIVVMAHHIKNFEERLSAARAAYDVPSNPGEETQESWV